MSGTYDVYSSEESKFTMMDLERGKIAGAVSEVRNFLSLARELRDLIYEAVLEIPTSDHHMCVIYPSGVSLAKPPDLALAGVNRQIRTEFLQTIRGKMSLFVICDRYVQPEPKESSPLNQARLECVGCLHLHWDENYRRTMSVAELEKFLRSDLAEHLINVTELHLQVSLRPMVEGENFPGLSDFQKLTIGLSFLFDSLCLLTHRRSKAQPLQLTFDVHRQPWCWGSGSPVSTMSQVIDRSCPSEAEFVTHALRTIHAALARLSRPVTPSDLERLLEE